MISYGDIIGYIALRNNFPLNVSDNHAIRGLGLFKGNLY